MVRAYHAIFTAYGFWLPNDPRGSWSDFVRSWELLRFGPATKTSTRRSVAHADHDRRARTSARDALRYPPVRFTGAQARAIARGFAEAIERSRYVLHACSVVPDHVHLVAARHAQSIETIVAQLKGAATKRLIGEGLHPLGRFDPPPSPWARGCWKVFLDDKADIDRCIRYVEANPTREGKRAQRWWFTTPA